MWKAAFVVIALAIPGTDTPSSQGWRDRDGNLVADSDHQKSKNGFGALLLLTDDETIFERWQRPEEPNVRTVTKAERNVPVHVLIIFVGPARDANGKAHVSYDARVLNPDGSVYGEFKDIKALDGPGAPDMKLQLSPASMAVRIEPQDQKGTYTVEATVRDNVRKVELKLKEKFTVEK